MKKGRVRSGCDLPKGEVPRNRVTEYCSGLAQKTLLGHPVDRRLPGPRGLAALHDHEAQPVTQTRRVLTVAGGLTTEVWSGLPAHGMCRARERSHR